MNVNLALLRRVYLVGGILMLGSLGHLIASEAYVMRTNLVQRSITNEIEVRVPMNTFVNEYHTNWIEQRRTNLVDVFATNRVVVEAVRTNVVKGYRTNWGTLTLTNDVRVDAFRTNFVAAYQTNWKTLIVTNQVGVDLFQTNLVNQYRTNSKTMFLTNWETVLIMKTNWVFQPVTNVVQIDLINNRLAAAETSAPRQTSEPNAAKASNPAPTTAATLSHELTIEATTTGRTVTNQVEVQLRAGWGSDSSVTVLVQRWRVEREDGAVLSFGQEAVFKRLLPPGKYRIEVRAQKEASGPMLAARGILLVTPRDAIMQQHLAASQ